MERKAPTQLRDRRLIPTGGYDVVALLVSTRGPSKNPDDANGTTQFVHTLIESLLINNLIVWRYNDDVDYSMAKRFMLCCSFKRRVFIFPNTRENGWHFRRQQSNLRDALHRSNHVRKCCYLLPNFTHIKCDDDRRLDSFVVGFLWTKTKVLLVDLSSCRFCFLLASPFCVRAYVCVCVCCAVVV